ncbi:MAG: signal peptidase I, partial [Alphaproteobacteria bacterium]
MAKEKSEEKQKNVILEYAQLVISVVVIVFVVRSFVFEPFRIPSESMDPTLKTGDYVIVTKFSYGFGRQSIFDIPLIDDRLFWREPKRGNVVVFADPSDPRRTKLIKRVVGVPGDTIEVRNSLLYINGEAA